MTAFSRILIANRGEIACRVIRTARAMGYSTVAVHSDADRAARHVGLADTAVCIGAAPVAQSYLNIDALLDAARRTGADAIHPGYGFLSENAEFAQRCAVAGITFIGPPIGAIELMGSKREAKLAMLQAGVPCVPGYEGDRQEDDALEQEALRIGFPLMIKASAGGGGRGMRRVADASGVREALQRARSEALNAFGNGELILEKCVDHARHVEIQVFGDHHGRCVHLGERDCSMQRRHQKVVEESPSPAVTADLRARMGEAAVRAALACHYVGAGTVEFLLDPDGNFYFLEMNTRLQVEHPVTECVTGEDLVEWQLRIAAGEPLPRRQDEIRLAGHAIEVRLYAEDARNGFLPQTGPILSWTPAADTIARTDHGIVEGSEVSRFYDPMLAKVICQGPDRATAIRALERALESTCLLGVVHNKGFLLDLIRTDVFRRGDATTHFIDGQYALPPDTSARPAILVAASLLLAQPKAPFPGATGGLPAIRRRPLTLAIGESVHAVLLDADATGWQWSSGTATHHAVCEHWGDGVLVWRLDGIRQQCRYAFDSDGLWIDDGQGPVRVENRTHAPVRAAEGVGSGILKAPMEGALTAILVTVGQPVARGDTVLVVEAMKMEHLVRADRDGVVQELLVSAGQQVKHRQKLAVIGDPG